MRLALFLLFTLTLVTFETTNSEEKNNPECPSLLGSRPTRETVYPGTILKVNADLDIYRLGKTLHIGFDGPSALPGDELLVLEGPKKMVSYIGGLILRLRILRTGEEGLTYWTFVQDGMKVLKLGPEENRIPIKPKPKKVLYPFKPVKETESTTIFNTRHAQVGDWVWLGSASRAMKVTNVGKVVEANNYGLTIRLFDGSQVSGFLHTVIPLTDEEISKVFSELEDEVKDRLGR